MVIHIMSARLESAMHGNEKRGQPDRSSVLCAQVLHGFDLDACQLLFDGGEVWATRDALRAWHTQAMLVQPLRQSST